MKYILASGSPRRKELLSLLGISYDIQKAEGEEITEGETPSDIVENLSRQKALEVAKRLCTNELRSDEIMIFGADTLVAKGNEVLGKPKDHEDAKRMLGELQGNTHEVYTGVTVSIVAGQEITSFTFHECTEVVFYPVTPEEIEAYVATGDCDDKAGSYAIQGMFGRYVKEIHGDYNNVVGLPVARLYHELKLRNLI